MKAINMKSIESVAESLTAAIKDAEGRATARTITASDIADVLLEVEKTLGISKKALEGVRVDIDLNAQTFPNSYKYIPESTQFTAVYKSGSWRVTDIRRDRCRGVKSRIRVTHTEESKAALIDRFTTIA